MKITHYAMLGIGLFILGCMSMPTKHPFLERVRQAYLVAQANPDIMENAAATLVEAEKAIKQAELAKTDIEIEHASYLADKYIQLAIAQTEQKKAEKQIEALKRENQQILYESRQKELEKALKEAEEKAKAAEMARLEAEQLRLEAEAKAKQAEIAREHAERAKEQMELLEKDLAELHAKFTDRGMVLTIRDVLFETGKADLMPGAMRSLDKLAAFLNKSPSRNILIEGHTDSVGGDAYNLTLSQQRADAVRTALVLRGVDGSRIITKGYGKKYPIASNSTESGRQQNRRVEIIILNEGVLPDSMLR